MAQQPIKGNQIDQSSLNIDNILPSQTGNNGKVLGTDGTNASWVTAGGGSGTVTSVDVDGGTTGLSTTGGPVTTSGTITLGGTLDETHGGTGQTSYATGDILYASGSNTLSKLSVGSDGQVLTLASGIPSWAAGGGGGGGDSYTLKPVRVATTANGTLASAFENGDTIDGVTLATGDRILIKNQSTASQNGIYVVQASGTPVRATDFDTGAATLMGGVIVPVIAGTLNAGTAWQCSNTTAITVGSTNITFIRQGVQGYIKYGSEPSTLPVATGSNSIAIGSGATTAATTNSIALLYGLVGGNNAIAIGQSSGANTESVSIGYQNNGGASNSSTRSVAIGYKATSGSSSTCSSNVAIGNEAKSSNSTSQSGNIAIGFNSYTGSVSSNSGNIAIGREAAASGHFGTQNYNTAIGYNALASVSNQSGMVSIGPWARTDFSGQIAFATGGFSSANQMICSIVPLYRVSTNETPVEMNTSNGSLSNSSTTYIILTDNSTYIFDCDIVARQSTTGTDYSAWNLKFCINREANAASTALVGTATKTLIGQTAGASTWDVSVSADTTNGRPKIEVTGEASKTIRWVANIRMTKVSG